MKWEPDLGEILVANGLVSRSQLEEAKARAATAKRSLEEILLEEGTLTPHQLARVRVRHEALRPVGDSEAKGVLIVEDEVELVTMLREILSAGGFRVATTMNGAEALAQCLTGRPFFPDAILLDLGIPIYRGAHLLSLLRENDRTRDLPVVVLTGRGDPNEEAEVRQLGISAYLMKPTPAARLIETLRAAVNGKPNRG